MSVSSVSNRPAPPPVQRQPEREPVKAKETQPKPKVEERAKVEAQPQAEAQPTYSKAKERTAAPDKGQRVDMRA